MKAHKSDSVATSDQNYSDPALKATCLERPCLDSHLLLEKSKLVSVRS
jgi:hypothetical protein